MRAIALAAAVFLTGCGCWRPVPDRSDGGDEGGGAGGIQIINGTYGLNCNGMLGNRSLHITKACAGKTSCEYRVDYGLLGDPTPNCQKDYVVEYRCAPGGEIRRSLATAEATGKIVFLDCFSPPGPGIRVEVASYGRNCTGAEGNATWSVGRNCNATAQCSYTVELMVLGDPSFECSKAFSARWNCGEGTTTQTVSLSDEAAGKTALLHCP
jgi:hypothetical protein